MIETKRLVAAVRKGNSRFEDLRLALGVQPKDFRALDRALQKAKKDGAILFQKGKGWIVAKR
jgi:hypothetical protein